MCSWRAGEPNAFWPSQICSHLAAKLGTPSTPSRGLEAQQLSPCTKGDFQAAWCCWALSASQAVQSASLLSLVSQNAFSREVRGSFAGGVILIPSLPDQFGMAFPVAVMETVPGVTEEGICVAFSSCQVWGGESPHFTQSKFPLGEDMSDLRWGGQGKE